MLQPTFFLPAGLVHAIAIKRLRRRLQALAIKELEDAKAGQRVASS